MYVRVLLFQTLQSTVIWTEILMYKHHILSYDMELYSRPRAVTLSAAHDNCRFQFKRGDSDVAYIVSYKQPFARVICK